MKTNLALAVLLSVSTLGHQVVADDARQLVESSGVQGGLVVHVGCGDGKLTASLRLGGSYLVHGLDKNGDNVNNARAHVRSLDMYGPVAIDQLVGLELPYADNLVNLLIVEEPGGISPKEYLRALAPGGVSLVKADGKWTKSVKPWPDGIDQWTHHLHDAGGNAVAADTVVGPPQHLQWTAGPRWARSHGWTPTVSAMVSSGGRLFAIVDETIAGIGDAVPSKWSLIARDAFSGVLLWKQPIPVWGSSAMSGTPDSGGSVSVGRFTMPTHLGKRLVAVDDTVYVTLGATAPVSALDAATGKVKQTYAETEYADEFVYVGGKLIISTNPPRRSRPAVVDKNDTPPPAPGKHVCAVDAASGQLLWKEGPFSGLRSGRGQDPFGRLELSAGDGNVFLLTAESIECLADESGERRWRIDRPALPENTVRRLGFSGMYEYSLTVMVYHNGVVLLAQPEPNTHHTYHTMPGTLYALNAHDGRELWQHAYGGWGHCTPPDIFVVGDVVWTHVNASTNFGRVWGNGTKALDTSVVDYRIQAIGLRTGELREEHSTADIFNVGHHHRCYRNKITERYLMSSRRGVEFVDLESGENYQNHWVRSGCKVGNLPCNGLLFVAPHPCQCYIDAKLTGFNALAPARKTDAQHQNQDTKDRPRRRLEQGPAYASVTGQTPPVPDPADWPTYRHDARRSGATDSAVATQLDIAWRSDVGTTLSSPVVAGGKLFVADVDTHTVIALDAKTGLPAWKYTAGARVMSPPTIHAGLAIFGSADGRVYCLRASDGEMVWRFNAAPEHRLVTSFGQLESAWPVPGVLVQDELCWFAAGRCSFMDGGVYVYALDPLTGNMMHEKIVYSPDPETGKMTLEPNGHLMQGLLNDIPGSDGTSVFVRQMNISSDVPANAKEHLYTTGGFLDSSWFNRTFWKIGRAQTTGPMVLGKDVAYGIEPYTSRSRDIAFQPGKNAFRLRCMTIAPRPVQQIDRRGKKVKGSGKAGVANLVWDQPVGIRGTSLTRTGDTLLLAGSPDIVDPADPHGAWEGRKGGILAAFSANDGSPQATVKLPAPPVWDATAVSGGRIYIALQDGTLVCVD